MRTRKRTSRIWLIPKDQLQDIIDSSKSIVEILQKLGFDGYNGNYKTLLARIDQDGLSREKFGINRRKQMVEHLANIRNPLSDNEIFCENSSYHRLHLKKKLVNNGYLKYRCEFCGIGNEYNGKPLSLQLDHKNGINNDNRIDNLRFLCPNCHSQTETFAGRRLKQTKKYESKEHREERIKNSRKVERPLKEDLEKLLWEKPTIHIAKEFGVSDKLVEKWSKIYGISKPPRGYWKKNKGV